MSLSKQTLVLSAFLFLATTLQAAPGKGCCDIVRVDTDRGFVWLRNPSNGLLAQFRPGVDIEKFKVGDRFNPDTNVLNKTKLDSKYQLVEPELVQPNATIIRARGAEVAVKNNETGKVYRFYALSFGAVLSSLKPGQEIVVDEDGGWAIIRWASKKDDSVMGKRDKVKPQTYAYKLD